VVDGQTFVFEILSCQFDDRGSVGGANVPFLLNGTGTSADGRPFFVEAIVTDLGSPSTGFLHSVQLAFTDSVGGWYQDDAEGGGDAEIAIDGQEVSFVDDFRLLPDDTPVGEGAFEAVCP
jgi:hypothetical protein